MFQEKIPPFVRDFFFRSKRLSSSFLGSFALLRSFLLCYLSFLLCHCVNL